jgi:hypothetical protein
MTAAIDVSESESSVNTESAFSAEESDYEPGEHSIFLILSCAYLYV